MTSPAGYANHARASRSEVIEMTRDDFEGCFLLLLLVLTVAECETCDHTAKVQQLLEERLPQPPQPQPKPQPPTP
jgi:hypothetical protein